jgi:cyanophycinase-like exopeptidase
LIYKAKGIDNLSQTNFLKMLRKIFLLLFLISELATAQQLIMVGGGKRTPDILTKFIELSGNENGKILVIPWASGEQEIAALNIKNEVSALSKILVEKAPFAPLTTETKATLLAQLKTAKGIFF